MRSIGARSDTRALTVADLTEGDTLRGGPPPLYQRGVRSAWHKTERPPRANVTLEYWRGFAEPMFRGKTPQGWEFRIPGCYQVVDLFDWVLTPGEGRFRGTAPRSAAGPARGGHWRWQSGW